MGVIAGAMACCMAMGTNTAGESPCTKPLKLALATPTTTNGCPLIAMVRLRMAGSPPKRSDQYAWQHGHRMSADAGVVIGHDRPPQYGWDSERGEVVAADHFGRRRLRVGPPSDAHGRNGGSQHARKRRNAIAQFLVKRKRENRFGVGGRSRGTLARPGVIAVQGDEPFRVRDRQRAQYHLVQERKDGGVSADSESEGQHSGCGEGRAPAQRAEPVQKVLPHHSILTHLYTASIPLAASRTRARSSAGSSNSTSAPKLRANCSTSASASNRRRTRTSSPCGVSSSSRQPR